MYTENRKVPLRAVLVTLLFILILPAAQAQEIHACVVMPTPASAVQPAPEHKLPPGVFKAVALGGQRHGTTNFWPNGSTLRIAFIGGSDYVRQRVMRYAAEWTRYANLNFQYVNGGPSDLRISFVRNGSSWSVLGRQAASAPRGQATMNFGWFDERTPEYEFRRTVLHEFGHALGLLHEHQNPSGGIPWNEEAVYAFYARTQGWDRNTTHQNVIARQRHDETQYSAYDARSIMHYPVDARLTRGDYQVGLNTELSPIDIAFITVAYPGRGSRVAETAPTAPAPRPEPTIARVHDLTISNQLGQGQRAEVVELYLDGRKYVYQLRQGQRNRQAYRLKLRPGSYSYRIRTASAYNGFTIYGDGTGRLEVDGSGEYSFVGKYDRGRGRMKVWIE